MISYIKGILEDVSDDFMIVETGGIGYQIFVSSVTLGKLPSIGNEVKIYTYMNLNMKEERFSFFGFCSKDELNVFHQLITVPGIGPKGALSLLAQFSPSELILAILSEDEKTLLKGYGIGKKTVQRAILELKDKLKNIKLEGETGIQNLFTSDVVSNSKLEAIESLVSLGYSKSEAVKAVSFIYIENVSTEELLKLALKQLAK